MQEKFKFINGFNDDDLIPFNCPFCNSSSLRFDKKSWFMHDKSKYIELDDAISPEDWVEYIYTSVIECHNKVCNQKIISSGIGKVDVDIDVDDYGKQHSTYYSLYKPQIFIPPLRFFEIPNNTPTEILSYLEKSFSLILQSRASAANCLRSCIEELLNYYQIPSEEHLHTRIKNHVPSNVHLKEYESFLMALKWLGNEGSHKVEVSFSLISHSFELIEYILIGLYGVKSNLAEKARLINELKRSLTEEELQTLG